MEDPLDDDEFAAIFASAETIPGWLTEGQARLLHDAARTLDADPVAVEIGTHQGRSAAVLASSLEWGRLVAIDPYRRTATYNGHDDHAALKQHLAEQDLTSRVDVLVTTSRSARRIWTDPIDLLYIDGKHDVVSCIQDLRWRAHVKPGAHVFVHDAFSSVGVTLAIVISVLPGNELAYVGRSGSLAKFIKRRPTWGERALIVRQCPWWFRNVGIKVLLRLGWHRLARAVGHHQGANDPY